MKAYQAHAPGGTSVTKATAREAAVAFFDQNPGKRKCNVVQGEVDGHFFTIAYGLARDRMPKSWKGVTKKTAQDLPGEAM